ncbi:PHD finger protein PERSISTENT TAPETAL CELL 1 [Magnolia sinica]|uniref:PHD finger protein PERSISTENT TAPETAL CELL 1 n=1 Tax=Magnolia sinica TaxID=86752 RepID=UPI0026595000|nr:PHD finger protein PERSISTENT TAPETAL CELL 1 [Magnolia sinica]
MDYRPFSLYNYDSHGWAFTWWAQLHIQRLIGILGWATNMHMNVGTGGCKKRKRGDRVFTFKTFCDPGHPIDFDGPFRQNIWALLEFGRTERGLINGMQCWSFRLEVHHHPTVHVSLFIVEEPIETSINRHCGHCRCVGWGHHMICNRRFHFVLPSKETAPAATSSKVCSDGVNCHEATESTATMKPNLVDVQGHLMHGVIHSNGFGHLLCVNGIEGGSEFIPGHLIMDFWDRICTGLRVRKVSVTDIAKKKIMELRLIHGVAYGEPWFGRWGYRFGRGSYGVTHQMYQKAIQMLRSAPLSLLTHHVTDPTRQISAVVARYQTMSGHSMQTLGHLFAYMLELCSHIRLESPIVADHRGIMTETACRWSSKRVEMAIWVIVEALRKTDFKWVSRQEVRDAARMYIGDTGLLDFVLKSLGNHIVGNHIVRRAVNPVTKVLEYCLEDISNPFPNHEGLWLTDSKTKVARFHVTRVQLMKDMYYLYKYILKDQRSTAGILAAVPAAVRIVLDTKHFIKDYRGELPRKIEVGWGGETLNILCTVSLRSEQEMEDERKVFPPHELVILPAHATIQELKIEVERSFRDVYWCLRSFVAQSIVEFDGSSDTDLIYGLIESGSSLVIRGRNAENVISGGIYEGRNDNWTVDCLCGAKEDDGERMISCDICEVWQHRRCVRASDDGPQIFVCSQCEHNIFITPPLL